MPEPIRILLIDDSTVIRGLLRRVIDPETDMTVVATASDGIIGLTQIEQHQPDLVVCDVEMPQMDGLETVVEIRKMGWDLPIIMFSTLTKKSADITMQALADGANDYATKPSGASDLNGSLEKVRAELLPKIRALTGRGPAQPVGPPPTAMTPRSVEPQPAASHEPDQAAPSPAPAAPTPATADPTPSAPSPTPTAEAPTATPTPPAKAPAPAAQAPKPTLEPMPSPKVAPAATPETPAPTSATPARPTASKPTPAPAATTPAATTPTPATRTPSPAAAKPAATPAKPAAAKPAATTPPAAKPSAPAKPAASPSPAATGRGAGGAFPAIDAVVIGSSTGGPRALEIILASWTSVFSVPVFIAQHMPPLFTQQLAEHLDKRCVAKVVEGEHGQHTEPGVVYIAPGGQHMTFTGGRYGTGLHVAEDDDNARYRPSVDRLYDSAAQVFQHNTLAVILTGMGNDGVVGAERLAKLGAPILSQNEETCSVWGMPRAVEEAGYATEVLPITEIGPRIETIVSMSAMKANARVGAAK
ncbi:MAG: chemotaxis protein CheB [Actinomycetota bacterium]